MKAVPSQPPKLFNHLEIVLLRPVRPGNVGSAARAMKNMGFHRLVLVNPCDHLASEGYRLGYGAHDILEKARIENTLLGAVSKSRFVVGVTGHPHQGMEPPKPLPEIISEILSKARRSTVSLLFGSEGTGLTREEVSLCHRLATIPTAGHHTSLNLAQAVLIVLYEILRAVGADQGPTHSTDSQTSAPVVQTERFYREMFELLSEIGFIKGSQGKSLLLKIRQIFSRTGLQTQEVRMLRGIVHHILISIRRARGSVSRKKPESSRNPSPSLSSTAPRKRPVIKNFPHPREGKA